MREDLLKRVLIEAQRRELSELPDEAALREMYTFSEGFERKMEAVIRQANRRYITIGRFTVRRALLVLIAAVLLLSGCIGIKEIREPLLEFFIKDYGKFSRVTFSEPDSQLSEEAEFTYELPSVPEGYAVVREDKFNDWHDVEFRNSENQVIYYMKVIPNGIVKEIDTEGAQLEEVIINGNIGIKFFNKGISYIIWASDLYSYTLMGTCDISILEEIAKKIK